MNCARGSPGEHFVELQQPSTSEIRLAKAGRAQVFAAADEILVGGRRPTIEAIQARLGGGSPNSIVAYLKEWYAELGERLAHTDAPAEGLTPEVHQAALDLQRALARQRPSNAATESTEALIRSLRAEVTSQQLLLDEMHAQRGRDQQAIADARALLLRKEDQLQDLQTEHREAVARLAVLQLRRRSRPVAIRTKGKASEPARAAKPKAAVSRPKLKKKSKSAATRRATRAKKPTRRNARRR